LPRVDLLPEPSEEDGRVARGRRRRRRTRLVAAVALGAVVMFFGAAALARMITDSDVVATQGDTTASASPIAGDTPSAAASPAESPVAVASPSPRVTTPAPTPTPTPTPAARPTAPVAVLNNSTIQGLAARSAERVRSVGFTVPRVGNVSGQIDRTTVYYRAGYREQADLLAGRLRGTQAIRPAPSWLPGSTALTLVVTSDFE
jgi:hypothetical protein